MKPFDYILYGLTVFAWSTSWLPLKWQLGVVAPEISLFWRFCIAAALMMIITKARGHTLKLPLRIHKKILVLAIGLFSLNFTLFYYGAFHVSSGLLAVVFSTASLMVIIIKAANEHAWPDAKLVFAAILGITGVGLIFLPEVTQGTAPLASLMLCLAGAFVFSLGNIASSKLQQQNVNVLTANCWGMVYGAIYLGATGIVRGHPFIIETTLIYIGGLLWLAVISSVLAFTCYLTLVGRIGPGRASYITVVFPVIALMISNQYEDYQWTWIALIGLACVVAGNTIMARSR